MAMRHIYPDKTEIVLSVEQKNKFSTVELSYDKITRIQIDKCKEFRLFRFVDSECIQITNRKTAQPIVYKKFKEKSFFEAYKTELEKFAKDNKITFVDNTKK